MKKVLLTIALVIFGASAFAQTVKDFYPAWFYEVKGGAAYTAGEVPFKDLISPAAALSAGYRFSPTFGLRGDFSGWQAKGGLSNTNDLYKWNHVQLNADAMFDILNLFARNKRMDRAVNPYILAGVGMNCRFNNDEAMALAPKFPNAENLWYGTVLGWTGRIGLGANFRLSDAVALTLEVDDNMYGDKFNSKKGDFPLDLDYHITALAGLKFSFGYAKKKALAAAAAEAAAAAAAAEAAAKAAAEAAAAAKAKADADAAAAAAAEAAAREAAERAAAEAAARAKARATTENVYYIINKTDIRDCEAGKVQSIVDIMNKYPEAVVTISGYADKETGNPTINMKLSKGRAEGVAKALEEAGISADRITVKYYGDTEKVSDVQEENRVSVCVTK